MTDPPDVPAELPELSFGMTIPFSEMNMGSLVAMLPFQQVGLLPFNGVFSSMVKAVMASDDTLFAAIGASGDTMLVVDREDDQLMSVLFLAHDDEQRIDLMCPKNEKGQALANRVTKIIEDYEADTDNRDPGDPRISRAS